MYQQNDRTQGKQVPESNPLLVYKVLLSGARRYRSTLATHKLNSGYKLPAAK